MISVSKIHNFATSTTVGFEQPEDLATFIIDNDWAHSVYSNGWRDKKNFVKTDLLVLDIDNGETQTCSLEQAVEVFSKYKHIIATSRNHNKPKNGVVKDRYRVILFLDKTITKGEDYSNTWKEAQKQWEFIDPSCCDESRFWYKSTEIISYNFEETAKLISVVETSERSNVVSYSEENIDGVRGIEAVDWSKCPKYMPKCIYLLTKGVAQPGERSRTFFILSRYYRNQGYGKETTYYLLKSIGKLNQDLYPNSEPISKDEIWNQHCSAAYNERGIDEMHVGTTGTSFEDSLLNKYCSLANNGKPCLLHNKKQEKKEIIKINDIADSFNVFAKAIDQNTIRTGINFIDENVRIMVGTPTLVVGSTGSGKTTLLLNIMEHNNKLGLNTVFFSLDMNRNMIYIKLAQKLTNYTQDQILDFYRSNNTTKIGEIKEIISSVYNKTYFDFTTAQTFVEVEQRVMDIEQKVGQKIKLVSIDYADRLIGAYQDEYNNSRFNALKSVEVADNTQTALMIISQISRQNGDVSTPLLSKRISRGSGAWEESSRVQLNIWREMYGQPEDDWIMNVFLAKNTLGKEIPGALFWDGAKSVIRDMSIEESDHYETNVKPMVEAKKSHSKFSI